MKLEELEKRATELDKAIQQQAQGVNEASSNLHRLTGMKQEVLFQIQVLKSEMVTPQPDSPSVNDQAKEDETKENNAA